MAWKTRFTRIYDIRPSVRYSSVRPYPRFILTRLQKLNSLIISAYMTIKGWFPLRKIILGSDRIGTKFNLNMRLRCQLAFLTTDIFASFGVLPLLHLRAYTLQDATVYTCSYLYSGNFIISTVKSRYIVLTV